MHSFHCSEWSFLPQRMSCQVQEGAALAQDHSCYRKSFWDSENSTNSLFSCRTGSEALITFPSLPGQVMSDKMNTPHTQQWQEQIFFPVSFREDDMSPVCLSVWTVCTTQVSSNCSSTQHCRSHLLHVSYWWKCARFIEYWHRSDVVMASSVRTVVLGNIHSQENYRKCLYSIFKELWPGKVPFLGGSQPRWATPLNPRLLLLLPQFRPDFQMPEATTL